MRTTHRTVPHGSRSTRCSGGHRAVSVCVGLGLVALGTQSRAAVSFEEIIPADATVARLATGFTFTEGPAWSPEGFLIFSDPGANRIVKLNTDGSIEDFLNPSGRANGLAFDTQGNLYLCQSGVDSSGTPDACIDACRRVSTLRTDGGLEGLVDSFNSKPLNSPNDLALDNAGGIYFTDPRYGTYPIPQDAKGVYYLDITGEPRRVIGDLHMPNGILVSNDGGRLYVAELDLTSQAHIGISMYPILSPGELGQRKRIYSFFWDDGPGPDGMAMDEHGNLFAAFMQYGPSGMNQIIVFDPEGAVLGKIPVPEAPSNCTFGGADGKTLFITARTSLYAIETKVRGAPLRSRAPTLASVIHSSPIGSATSTETIVRVSFTKPMDRASVEAGLSMSPTMAGAFEWSNLDRALTFRPDTPWAFSGELIFRISGDVLDATGLALDGNANQESEGSPADDYEWSFTFLSPTLLSFNPNYGDTGARILLIGANLTDVTNVRFNGTDASFNFSPKGPDSVIFATVPPGSTTGPISVEGPSGTFTTATPFYVGSMPPPSIVVSRQSDSTFSLRWPISEEAILEECDNLNAPVWGPVTASPSVVSDKYELILEPAQAKGFYRLRFP